MPRRAIPMLWLPQLCNRSRAALILVLALSCGTPGLAAAQQERLYEGEITTWVKRPVLREDGSAVPGAYYEFPETTVQFVADPETDESQDRVQTRVYDAEFGNLKRVVDKGPLASEDSDDLVTEYEYAAPNRDDWLVAYPRLRVTGQRLGAPDAEVLGAELFEYDGLVNGVTEGKRTARVVHDQRFAEIRTHREEWGHDPFGNPIRYRNPLDLIAGRDTFEIVYRDDYNSFVESITNGLSQRTLYAHDPRYGVVTRVLAANGQLECRSFDAFGRLEARSEHSTPVTASPASIVGTICDRILTRFSFENLGSPESQHVLTRAWASSSAPDPVASREYFDGLGRVYHEAREARAGGSDYFVQSREWGPRGELRCEWLPAREGSPDPPPLAPGYAGCVVDGHGPPESRRVFSYDAVLRPRSVFHGSSLERESTWSVEDWDASGSYELVQTLRVQGTPELVRITRTDARGNVESVTEQGGSTTRIHRDAKGRAIVVDGPDILTEDGVDENLLAVVYDTLDRRVAVGQLDSWSDPTGPVWEYAWDENGNLEVTFPPSGETRGVVHEYDVLDRLIRKDYFPHGPATGAEDAIYEFDTGPQRLVGRLVRTRASSGVETAHDWSLDGRQHVQRRTIRGVEAEITEASDWLGRRSQVRYPGGTAISYHYDGGVLAELRRDGSPFIDGIQMHPSGALSERHHVGPDVTTFRTHPDAVAQRLEHVSTFQAGGSMLQDLTLEYDLAGNLRFAHDDVAAVRVTQSFEYDGLHRLQRAEDERPGGYGLLWYEYDAAGNRRRFGTESESWTFAYGNDGAVGSAITSVVDDASGATVRSYTYDSDGQVDSRTAGAEQISLSWGPEGRLVSAAVPGATVQYRYDVDGMRTTRWSGANVRDHFTNYFAVHEDGRSQNHVFVGAERIATIQEGASQAETQLHYFPNLVGSNELVVSGSGQVENRSTLSPYGIITRVEDASGSEIAPSDAATPYQFSGHHFDFESGLHYMGARYYDPIVGRFLSFDPALIGAVSDRSFARVLGGAAQNANAYSYALNRTTVHVDPDGRAVETAWDLFNVALGVDSFRRNWSAGNYWSAGLDAVGVIGDSVSAAVPLVPGGLGASLRVVRGVEKGVDVARGGDRAADSARSASRGTTALSSRAQQIHGALDPIAQSRRTTAVLRTNTGDIVAGGARDLTPAQRALLGPGETAARLPGAHAEVTALQAAQKAGSTPQSLGVTRTICPQCAEAIEASGGVLTSPTTAVFP